MIKFGINPKIWEGERCKFGKLFKKCQHYRFVDIFWDILNKMKDNLGQESLKEKLLSFQRKIGISFPDFSGKMTVFSSFGFTFPPVPP